jgi:NhaP-type Na+/H+ or K+/H+ antiporter
VLLMIVIAIIAGVISQILSVVIGIPSIVVLFIVGISLGPEVLGFLNPDVFGRGFETIIRLCVAIILFEAGLNLDKSEIKKHQKIILPLITYGALITMVFGAIFAMLITDLTWSLAFLFGSLVIVTGPTVIHPLLRRIKVESRLKNILETEGVIIDPIGAIIAIFVFELILEESHSFLFNVFLVFWRLGIGIVIGVIGGYVIGKIVMRFSLVMEDFVDLFVLASALGIYALSEAVIPESGLMAAVASGAILGNMHIPEEEPLKKFKGKLSILVISVLFVLLAADLELRHVVSLGWGGVIVVLAVLIIVRPLQIFVTTIGSDLRFNEKAFLSYISPRGIIAASVASIFAFQLSNRGIQGGDIVQGLVFLTIGISVLLQGTTAGTVAKFLGVLVESQKAVIVGANAFGRVVGKLLKMNGKQVGFVDSNEYLVRLATQEGFEAIEGNSLDLDVLERIGLDDADTALAVTTSNKVNIFVSRLAKIDFGIKNSIPVLNKARGDVDKTAAEKLGLNIAFARSLSMYDINPKIAKGEYRVLQCVLMNPTNVKRLEDLSLPDEFIPIMLINSKMKIPAICKSGLNIEAGDKIIIIDLSNGSISPDKAFLRDCSQLKVQVATI